MLVMDSSDMTEDGDWLIPVATRTYKGDRLDIFYYLENKSNPCGKQQTEDFAVYSVSPEGNRQNLEMICSKENCRTYRIEIEKNGLYHLIVEQTGYLSEDAEGKQFEGTFKDNPQAVSATHYLHYSHTVLQVGHGLSSLDCAELHMPPLRIIPDSWDSFKAGEVFAFTLYFRESPLPLYDIGICCIKGNDNPMFEKFITNGSGKMFYPIKTPGKYVIVVRYTSPECKEGFYYDTRYTYSFWFIAKRQTSTS